MTKRFWKRVVQIWVVCGVLIWAGDLYYFEYDSPLSKKAILLPVRVATWPIRLYGLIPEPEVGPSVLESSLMRTREAPVGGKP